MRVVYGWPVVAANTHMHAPSYPHTHTFLGHSIVLEQTADSLFCSFPLFKQLGMEIKTWCFWPIFVGIHAALVLYTLHLIQPPDHTYSLITHSCSLFSSVPPLCFLIYRCPLSLSGHINLLSLSIILSSAILLAAPPALCLPHLITSPPSLSSCRRFPFDTLCVFISIFLSHCSLTLLICLTSIVFTSLLCTHIGTHSGNTLPPTFSSDNIYQNRQCYR